MLVSLNFLYVAVGIFALIIMSLAKDFESKGVKFILINPNNDKNNKEEYQKAGEALKDIFEATLKLEGTISGEHGVGLTKKPYIGMELSGTSIELMKAIKKGFDPEGLLNPGKIFPDE